MNSAALSMEAALRSYDLAAGLSEDARVLWERARVSTATGLAVMSLEADAKGTAFVADVTEIGARRVTTNHRQRIGDALDSLRLILGSELQDIAGSVDLDTLDVNHVWDLRQHAFYVDQVDDVVHGPHEISEETAATLVALATNATLVREPMRRLDRELLASFFQDYGAAYRQHIEPVDAVARAKVPVEDASKAVTAWAAATAHFFAELGDAWDFDHESPYGVTRLRRR